MDRRAKDVIMIIADISGYTRYMMAHQKALAHSQVIIGELLNTILEQVELPLTISKPEGDAVFLYAVKDESPAAWEATKQAIGHKLITFFQVFSDKIAELTQNNICRCEACANIGRLKLKVIGHSGTVVLYKIGPVTELSGADAIIVHRLLKNSLQMDEYILFTAAAQRDIPLPLAPARQTTEHYDDVGEICTFVYLLPPAAPYVADPKRPSPVNAIFLDTLRAEIRREYAQVADQPEKGFHFHTGRPLACLLGYRDEWLAGMPEASVESLAGTGNPFSLGTLQPGEHVVDVGCGAGLDSLIAARMVGPRGQVIGVDMTPQMLEKARGSAAELGLTNVEFREGLAEELPAPDGWADVVISNGVLNLTPDKAATLREMARVLKPKGRLQIGDILVDKPVPAEARLDIDLWAG
jgi:arsenite methyltransferase